MNCPYCKSDSTCVLDTWRNTSSRRRIRKCCRCGKRFITNEIYAQTYQAMKTLKEE